MTWSRTLVVFAVILLGGVIAAGIAWLLFGIGEVILVFLLAGFLSFILMPVVDWLSRPRLPRPVAVLISYLLVAAIFVGIGFLVLPPLIEQATQLAQQFPQFVQQFQDPNSDISQLLRRLGIGNPQQLGSTAIGEIQTVARAILSNILIIVRDATTVAVGFVLVLVIGFYFLTEGHDFRGQLNTLLPLEHKSKLKFIEDTLGSVIGGYFRGQLIVAVTVAVLATISALVVGLQYPLVVGVLAGVFELIPFFGPVLSAVPAAIIALFQGPITRFVAIVGVFIVIQQLESNVIYPRITGRAVGLHPLAIMFAVLVGIKAAGFWGALFAVPVAGLIWALLKQWYYVATSRPEADKPIDVYP